MYHVVVERSSRSYGIAELIKSSRPSFKCLVIGFNRQMKVSSAYGSSLLSNIDTIVLSTVDFIVLVSSCNLQLWYVLVCCVT